MKCHRYQLTLNQAKQMVTLRRKADIPGEPQDFKFHFADPVDFWKFLMYTFGSRLGGLGLTVPDITNVGQSSTVQPPGHLVNAQGTGQGYGGWGHGM